MRRSRVLTPLMACLLSLLFIATMDGPRGVEAHPLGNFSVNRLVLIDLAEDGGGRLRYVVDAAEIPTFQKFGSVDVNGDGVVSTGEEAAYLEDEAPRLLGNLDLEVDDVPVPLTRSAADLQFYEGQGGLKTSRLLLDAAFELPLEWQDGVTAVIRDGNYRGEPGWQQIVVRPGRGVDLFRGDVVILDITNELTEYPEELLDSPPSVSAMTFGLRAGTTAIVHSSPDAATTVSRDDAGKRLGGFASIVSRQHLTPAFAALALLLAAGWGAMHALGPGHGKTVVAAYLVGERGTARHALLLGLVVTITHTVSVFALGGVALFASGMVATDDIFFWLSLASGALVAALGGYLLLTRLNRLRRQLSGKSRGQIWHHDHHHAPDPEPDHDHHDDEARHHGHSHAVPGPGWRGLVALGVSGGLVPCPTALVVMLGAIALDRVIYGLVLVAAFSAGLAAVLTGIGLLLVCGRRLVMSSAAARLFDSALLQRVSAVAPVLSALGILGAGLLLTGRAML